MPNRRPNKQRILVVDRSERIRRDIRAFLENSGRYEIVGEAATLGDAAQVARTTLPQIVLVDVEMAEGDGLSVLRELRLCLPPNALVIATHSDWEEYDEAARAAGAAASIHKTQLFRSLMQTLAEATGTSGRGQGGPGGGANESALARNGLGGSKQNEERVSNQNIGLWWRPRTWREWLAGLGEFASVLVHGAPMESSPPTSYWRYFQIAMVVLVSMLLVAVLSGSINQAGYFSRVLILVSLLVLAGAQFRQIRRVSSATRAFGLDERLKNTHREAQE